MREDLQHLSVSLLEVVERVGRAIAPEVDRAMRTAKAARLLVQVKTGQDPGENPLVTEINRLRAQVLALQHSGETTDA